MAKQQASATPSWPSVSQVKQIDKPSRLQRQLGVMESTPTRVAPPPAMDKELTRLHLGMSNMEQAIPLTDSDGTEKTVESQAQAPAPKHESSHATASPPMTVQAPLRETHYNSHTLMCEDVDDEENVQNVKTITNIAIENPTAEFPLGAQPKTTQAEGQPPPGLGAPPPTIIAGIPRCLSAPREEHLEDEANERLEKLMDILWLMYDQIRVEAEYKMFPDYLQHYSGYYRICLVHQQPEKNWVVEL